MISQDFKQARERLSQCTAAVHVFVDMISANHSQQESKNQALHSTRNCSSRVGLISAFVVAGALRLQ